MEVGKQTVGKELNAGQFEFVVKEGDNIVAKATNEKDGRVLFNDILYTEVGTHT